MNIRNDRKLRNILREILIEKKIWIEESLELSEELKKKKRGVPKIMCKNISESANNMVMLAEDIIKIFEENGFATEKNYERIIAKPKDKKSIMKLNATHLLESMKNMNPGIKVLAITSMIGRHYEKEDKNFWMELIENQSIQYPKKRFEQDVKKIIEDGNQKRKMAEGDTGGNILQAV